MDRLKVVFFVVMVAFFLTMSLFMIINATSKTEQELTKQYVVYGLPPTACRESADYHYLGQGKFFSVGDWSLGSETGNFKTRFPFLQEVEVSHVRIDNGKVVGAIYSTKFRTQKEIREMATQARNR